MVERHRPRVAHLEYVGEVIFQFGVLSKQGDITSTIFLVGKGITYDTGGADVKVGLIHNPFFKFNHCALDLLFVSTFVSHFFSLNLASCITDADLQAGGHMAGMHRDKCGAAVVCGIFAVLSRLRPRGLRVVGKLALVRNSIGADAYVADEVNCTNVLFGLVCIYSHHVNSVQRMFVCVALAVLAVSN